LKGYVKKFKVESNVCFLGYYPDEMLPRLYQAADIFVFPSIYENMPFAVLEALASGLPVITTKVGGIPEIIDDGENGFLIEPFNARKLAERLLYLVENPTVAYEMGAAGRKTVEERFNWNKIIKQITAVYREVLA
ncbi:MAG: glycosyltransferase family 4 protein, partial [Candidatus Bathyarchaeia archaeon]